MRAAAFILAAATVGGACTPDEGGDDAGTARDAGPRRGGEQLVVVDTERIQNPSWQPIDFRLVPVPLGAAEDGYLQGYDDVGADLAPGHAWSPDDQLYAPGDPHAGYANELEQSVGDRSATTFTVDQFTPPNGIVAVFTLVPIDGDVRGSSPDDESPDGGVIVANDVFPIVVEGQLAQGDVVVDSPFAREVLAPPDLSTPYAVDGASHVVLGFALSHEAAPEGTPIPGAYQFDLLMRDATNQGWTITLRFTVGTPCDCDDECAQGETCTPTPAGVSVCSASCRASDALCPAGQACVLSGEGGDDVAGVCQTSSEVLHPPGSVCATDGECLDGVCLAVASVGRSICRKTCEDDDECPALYACTDGVCLFAQTGTACPVEEEEPQACGATASPTLLALAALLTRTRGRRARAAARTLRAAA